MNLYIIGNGFDLDLGYNTSYNSFIKSKQFNHIIQNNSSNNLAKYISQNIYNNNKRWVDLEILLGEYANEFCKDEVDILNIHLKELKNELKLYLNEQETNYDILRQQKSSAFKMLKHVHTELVNNLPVSVINFNYTNTFLNRLTFLNKGIAFQNNLINYYHPHGTLNDDFALGLNDEYLQGVGKKYSFLKKRLYR